MVTLASDANAKKKRVFRNNNDKNGNSSSETVSGGLMVKNSHESVQSAINS